MTKAEILEENDSGASKVQASKPEKVQNEDGSLA